MNTYNLKRVSPYNKMSMTLYDIKHAYHECKYSPATIANYYGKSVQTIERILGL